MIILKFQVKTPVSMLTTHWANNLPNMFQNFQTLPGSSRFQNRLRTNKLISESNSTHSNRIDRISLTYHVFRSIYIYIYLYLYYYMISISFTLRFGIYHALMKIMGTYPGSFGCQELMILPFSCDLAEQALGHGTSWHMSRFSIQFYWLVQKKIKSQNSNKVCVCVDM